MRVRVSYAYTLNLTLSRAVWLPPEKRPSVMSATSCPKTQVSRSVRCVCRLERAERWSMVPFYLSLLILNGLTCPSPAPMTMAVGLSISFMPGPPLGPSYLVRVGVKG